jgi:predicted RNA binding protein YcfA (HicA-like mRNA interferase family)
MKSSELLRMLKKDGWFIIRQSGSHIIMRHSEKQGTLSFPFHASNEVKRGLLHGILKKVNIKTSKR